MGGPHSRSRRFRELINILTLTGTELFLESPARNDATAPTTSVFPILICTWNSLALASLLRNPHRKLCVKLNGIQQTTQVETMISKNVKNVRSTYNCTDHTSYTRQITFNSNTDFHKKSVTTFGYCIYSTRTHPCQIKTTVTFNAVIPRQLRSCETSRNKIYNHYYYYYH